MKPRHIVLKFLLILCLGLLLAAFACFFFPQQVLTVDSGAVRHPRRTNNAAAKPSFQTGPENVRFPLLLG